MDLLERHELASPPGRVPKFPIRHMELGESFFFPGAVSREIGRHACRYKPMKFRSRSVVCGGIQGVRVWRIA